jgi:hypothetical protein
LILRPLPRVALLALCCLAAATPLGAHDFSLTEVTVVFRADDTYRIDMIVDVDALVLGVSPSVDSAQIVAQLRSLPPAKLDAAVERTRQLLVRRLRIRFDGTKQRPVVSFPERDAAPDPQVPPTVLGVIARLEGPIPPGSRDFTFGASRAFGPVHLTLRDETRATETAYPLGVAEDSPVYSLSERAASAGRLEIATRYAILGFEHILPLGLDHILFVVGLFLLSTRLGPLLWQVTAFTVAHTVSLALSMFGMLSLPSRLVESLIALSICYVAVENLLTREMKPWRPVVVFGFGLLHGLGFAGVLRELGLPRDRFASALVSFNLGVEAGQLCVILLALVAVGWYRKNERYRARVVVPASAIIAAVGLYWSVTRAL